MPDITDPIGGHGLLSLIAETLAERAAFITEHLDEISVRIKQDDGSSLSYKLRLLPVHLAVPEAFRLLLRIEPLRGILETPHVTLVRTVAPLADWDRSRLRQQIEEASGRSLSVDDSLPDSFIATAQALGMEPHELQMWIYDGAAADRDWSQGALVSFARRYGFARNETGQGFTDSEPKEG